jgi:UDP-N-acetylmuramoyl-tripeptide--D-alanyl-D-alanine ligase
MPWHHAAVFEAGTDRPGRLVHVQQLLRPDIAVILTVKMEHRTSFWTLEAIAKEKATLALAVRPGGTVWLNADDPLVAAMETPPNIRRRLFGMSPATDLRASNVEDTWPQPLRFTAHYQNQTAQVTTQLMGEHWLPAALATLGVATDCGMSLSEAAAALSRVPPMRGRSQLVQLSTGATMIRDDFKGGVDTVAPVIRSLAKAKADRRWLVFSGFDETARGESEQLKRVARDAKDAADYLLFVGEHTSEGHARALREGFAPDRVFQATTVRQAGELLRKHSRPGDLILLKGRTMHHISRVYWVHEEERYGRVQCDRFPCHRNLLCDWCSYLHGSGPLSRLVGRGPESPP